MPEHLFRRCHVEWAIWSIISTGRSFIDEPPPQFRARIKKLLERDRSGAVRNEVEPPARFAFSDADQTCGPGVDAEFTAFDAFCLFMAIRLVNVGFTQNEAVFLIRYAKPQLHDRFAGLSNRVFGADGLVHVATRPPMESEASDGTAVPWDDGACFVVLRKQDFAELHDRQHRRLPSGEPLSQMNKPVFCEGREALTREILKWPAHCPSAFVQELTWPVLGIVNALQRAPDFKRGRRRADAYAGMKR